MLQINNTTANTQIDRNMLTKITAIFVMAGLIATALQPLTNPTFQAKAATFDQRCAATGVVVCAGFNNINDVNDFVSGNDLGELLGTVDTTIKSSGDGSLKFIVPSMSGENSSGAYDRVFNATNTGYGTGSTFYVQFKQRFSDTMLNDAMGGNGWKQVVLSSQFGYYGDPIEVGLYNLDYDNKPVLFQNGQVYLQTPADGTPVQYVANEWMTFAIKVTVGNWSENESKIQVWAARENENLEEIYNITASIPRNPTDPTSGFNKVTFGPHNTGKLETTSHSIATTWYDELIVSSQPIVDPVPTVDRVAPNAPTLTATTAGTSINLSWTASTDNTAVTGYKLFRNGVEITDQTGLTFTDANRVIGTNYSYTVKAYDAANNISVASNTVTASVSDTIAPTAPVISVVVNETTANVSWTASTDNVGVTTYKLFRDGAEIANQNTLTYSNTGLTRNTTYKYTVKAFDAAGNSSVLSNEASAVIAPEIVVEPNPTPTPTPTPTPPPTEEPTQPSKGGGSSKPRKPKSPRHPRTTLVEDKGTIYFLGDKYRYAFPSIEIFNSWDAKLTDVVKATDGDMAMPEGPVVEPKVKEEARHQRGTLVSHNGTIYFMGESVRYPFPSVRVFKSWGAKFENVVAASAGDLVTPIGEIVKFKN